MNTAFLERVRESRRDALLGVGMAMVLVLQAIYDPSGIMLFLAVFGAVFGMAYAIHAYFPIARYVYRTRKLADKGVTPPLWRSLLFPEHFSASLHAHFERGLAELRLEKAKCGQAFKAADALIKLEGDMIQAAHVRWVAEQARRDREKLEQEVEEANRQRRVAVEKRLEERRKTLTTGLKDAIASEQRKDRSDQSLGLSQARQDLMNAVNAKSDARAVRFLEHGLSALGVVAETPEKTAS